MVVLLKIRARTTGLPSPCPQIITVGQSVSSYWKLQSIAASINKESWRKIGFAQTCLKNHKNRFLNLKNNNRSSLKKMTIFIRVMKMDDHYDL